MKDFDFFSLSWKFSEMPILIAKYSGISFKEVGVRIDFESENYFDNKMLTWDFLGVLD